MAECDSCESETVDLGYIFRSQAKYGTTAHTVHRDDVYVKHKVKPEETLQGISLSYGVTVSLTALSTALHWPLHCSAVASAVTGNGMTVSESVTQ